MNRILIATDGSEGAWAAVEEGVKLAAEIGADVTFVKHQAPRERLLGDHQYQQHLTEHLTHARAALDAAEAEARRAGVEFDSDILEGDPALRIAQAARGWEAVLVVVGSRGHGRTAPIRSPHRSRSVIDRTNPVALRGCRVDRGPFESGQPDTRRRHQK